MLTCVVSGKCPQAGLYLPLFSELKVRGGKGPQLVVNTCPATTNTSSDATKRIKEILTDCTTARATAENAFRSSNFQNIFKTLRISRLPAPAEFLWSPQTLLVYLLVSRVVNFATRRVAIFSIDIEMQSVLCTRSVSNDELDALFWFPQARVFADWSFPSLLCTLSYH